jgi:hypothetical protein
MHAKSRGCALLLFFIAAVPAATQDSIDTLLGNTLRGFSPGGAAGMVVAIGNFTYADKGMGSAFSGFLQEKLGMAIGRTAGLELFAREKLDEILKVQELNLSDLVDQRTAVSVGNLKGVQGLFSGRFFDSDANVRVFLQLVDVEKGTVKRSTEVLLPRSAIPSNIRVSPDNYANALLVANELAVVRNADNPDLRISAWTERGDGGVYREGEEMVVHFSSNHECFIKLYHIDVNGKMQLIFPNQYDSDNRLQGDRVYTIPDTSYPFRFKLTAPFGAEFIKVIASKVQFKEIEQSFREMGSASRSMIARSLGAGTEDAQVSEALMSYTVVPRGDTALGSGR